MESQGSSEPAQSQNARKRSVRCRLATHEVVFHTSKSSEGSIREKQMIKEAGAGESPSPRVIRMKFITDDSRDWHLAQS